LRLNASEAEANHVSQHENGSDWIDLAFSSRTDNQFPKSVDLL